MSTILITGISSFVGHHVIQAFAEAGYRVVGTYASQPDTLDPLRRARFEASADIVARRVRLDILSAAEIKALVLEERPTSWVQLAGLGRNFASDAYDLDEAHRLNLRALDLLYPALAEVGAALVGIGSGMEYGRIDRPHPEDAPCWPDSPYGLSKLAATLRMRQLAMRFGVPTRVARVYTVFGELDGPDRLVTRLIARLRSGVPVGLAPGVNRDICDMRDVAEGFVHLARDCAQGPPFDLFNLSRGAATPLRDVALAVAAEIGADPGLIADDPAMHRPSEPPTICGDSTKAWRRLGWQARPIEAGLRRLAAAG